MSVEGSTIVATQGLQLDKRQLAMLEMMGVQHAWPARVVVDTQVVQSEELIQKAPAEVPQKAPTDASSRHQASNSLQALAVAISSCQQCALSEKRIGSTLGEGQPGSGWMFVLGSSPVAADRELAMLKGSAQQLLLAMTRALGLHQQAHWVTTASKCASSSSAPTVEDMRACMPHLKDQVALTQPRVLVVMGTGAAQAMGLAQAQEPLGKLRNQRHEFAGVPVVITYPPEFLLRHPQEKARVWEDLCLAASWVETPTMPA
ncbi:MAG: hypothetical protein RLZZ397_468 [Pseudomonadota bacterium]